MDTHASDSRAELQPSGKRAGHDRRGRFTKGNTEALKHGRFSMAVARALLPEQHELLSTLQEHEAAILGDLGGRSELSTLEVDLVTRYQQLGAIADFNAARMLASRASVRREASTAFMNAVDRQLKIIGMLGTARRTKPVAESPIEYLRRSIDKDDASGSLDNENASDDQEPPS